MVFDLRPLGVDVIIKDGVYGLGTKDWKSLKIAFGTVVGGGTLTFPNKDAMDEWVGQFTGKTNNFPSLIDELPKPKIEVFKK